MTAPNRSRRLTRLIDAAVVVAVLGASLLFWTPGCEREPSTTRPYAPADELPSGGGPDGDLSLVRVEYEFAPDLRAAHPELSAFLSEVLDAVLAGDYQAYRNFVARSQTPESEERFESIHEALRRVRVEAIEPVTIPDVPPPSYRARLAYEFDPASRAAQRIDSREIALLIFREAADWRLMVAPRALQPESEPETPATTTAPASKPADTGPDYPWDEGVDY